jgi:hypothetical protein
MKAEARNIVNQLEEIKTRLLSVEILFLESEQATREDKKAVKEALIQYKNRKTTSFDV